MKHFTTILILTVLYCICSGEEDGFLEATADNRTEPSDVTITVEALINLDDKTEEQDNAYMFAARRLKTHGYELLKHEVKTEDGYILDVFHIPAKGGNKTSPAVLLMHGMFCSSDAWIKDESEALLYLYANAGYNVWLGNFRGNHYTRKEGMKSHDDEFWNFSWHEMGVYDLPATIDYVLKTSGRKKLAYIGYSLGTTAFFVMCSMKPQYNNRIAISVALAPVAWISSIDSPISRSFASYADYLYKLSQFVGMSTLSKYIFTRHMSGTSMKQLIHYMQEMESGKFCQFDYGKNKDMELYKSLEAPEYPVENITAPVAIYIGTADELVNLNDARTLKNRLPNVVAFDVVNNCNHYTFMFDYSSVMKYINSLTMEIIYKYTNH